MRRPNYLEMEEVLNTYWISRKEMQILLPQLSYSKVAEEFNSILFEMKENNEPYFETRPILIPVEKIIEKYKINKSYILKEAARLRKGLEQNEKKT